MQRSKAYTAAADKIDKDRLYSPVDAVKFAQSSGSSKFDSTVDVAMRLGVDPRKADQMVRGTVNLPHGTGKTAKVLVFANAAKADEARAAGADVVGGDELIDKVKPGKPDVLLMSRRTRRGLKQARRIAGPVIENHVDQFGQQVETYDWIPIVADDFVPDNEVQGTSGAVCSSVFALKFGMSIGLMGLQHGGITIESVGELETKDATRHRIKWYTGLALMSELGVARIGGITA